MYVKFLPENLNSNPYPHTSQVLISAKWSLHQKCVVVKTKSYKQSSIPGIKELVINVRIEFNSFPFLNLVMLCYSYIRKSI